MVSRDKLREFYMFLEKQWVFFFFFWNGKTMGVGSKTFSLE
jgi:hypothetical protein